MVCGIYILTDFDKIENILVVDYPSSNEINKMVPVLEDSCIICLCR